MKDDSVYLAHDYLGIDLERVWQIVQEEVQALKKAILRLSSEDSE